MDIGYAIAAFAATIAGNATGNILDPLVWILAGAVGTERMRAWRYLVAAIFAAVKTGVIAARTTAWIEDPIIPSDPWVDLVGKFIGAAIAFLAVSFLATVVARGIEKHRSGRQSFDE